VEELAVHSGKLRDVVRHKGVLQEEVRREGGRGGGSREGGEHKMRRTSS
jgi:hypothetical protein